MGITAVLGGSILINGLEWHFNQYILFTVKMRLCFTNKRYVSVYLDKMREEFREKVVNGAFTLVAIGDDGRPVPVIY